MILTEVAKEYISKCPYCAGCGHKQTLFAALETSINETIILRSLVQEVIDGYNAPEIEDFDWEGWYKRAIDDIAGG